jgi:hypothetical protein
MNKIMNITFAMIDIIFYAASTIILFTVAAIISLMATIATMIFAPFTLFVESANITVMRSWITAPFNSAIKNSSSRWEDLLKHLSRI